jgi:3-deoxy-D-manno-octulosonic-acid transferase
MAGKPVVFGPHMENFAPLAKGLLLEKGAIQVGDVDSFERAVTQLLQDNAARECLVRNARQVLSKHEGATARTAALVHEL